MTGPAPKSKAILEMAGSWRAKDRGDDAPYDAASARAPKTLTGVARAEWNRIAPLMLSAGTLREVDRAALIGYCEAFADFMMATAALKKWNRSKGYASAIMAGLVAAKNKCRAEMLKCATALGITPASATRVTVKPPTLMTVGVAARKRV
jgi:P27 family predicted phage terminase small subunit